MSDVAGAPPPKVSFAQTLAWRFEALVYDIYVFLVRLLPIDMASDLGAFILKVLGPLTPTDRLVRKNLDLAFPDKDAAWKDRIAREQWDNLGRNFFGEMVNLDRIIADPKRVEIMGAERLAAIRDGGRPVVFISGHFACFEVMPAAILHAGIPCQITYRAMNNPYVDKRVRAARARYGVKLFAPKGGDGSRELLQGMAKGESVALMNDQKFNRGVPTPFFGLPVDTAPGPTRLAQRFGTVLQPMTVERLHKARFRVVVHEPIEVDHTGNRSHDIETTVAKVSAFIEEVVRARPEEWFWVHKRWPDFAYKGSARPVPSEIEK